MAVTFAQASPSSLGGNESWEVKGQQGDGYCAARVSQESHVQLPQLC